MSNEAELRVRIDHPINFTCANTIGVEKGTLMLLTDPLTASKAAATGGVIAGIAATEKIASDGRTSIACYRRGIFDMVASGAITVGQAVANASDTTYQNQVKAANAATSGAGVLGHALETATDQERILIYVDIGAGAP